MPVDYVEHYYDVVSAGHTLAPQTPVIFGGRESV